LYPHVTSPLITQVFEKKIALVREDHDQVITPSLTIANEVLSMHIDSSRVHTISEAPNPDLLAAPHIDIHQRFGIQGAYILMVGTAERKNIHRSYDAFCLLNRPNTSLVIVGEPNKHLPINPRIIYTGFVTTHELSNLYQNAIVFLYSSLYEGFGLPILEAYALGCPVVTSNVGSMQELSQESAILVNPYDVHGIANGVKQALVDKLSLIKKAKRLVKNYTWRHTARETLKIYTKAYEHR
jgi:glycosyltransferase involved in cell wall biosynthesis